MEQKPDAPLARIQRRTLQFLASARHIAGPNAARAEHCLAQALGIERLDDTSRIGRSALNGDGVPLQLCLTSGQDGQFLRIIGDPCAHLQGAARIAASRAQLLQAMAKNGATDLLPVAEATLSAVLPNDMETQEKYTDGAIWLALATERPGVALYVEAATRPRDNAWDLAGTWLSEILSDDAEAHQIVARLRPYCTLASYGLEGTGPKAGRAKLYFRLAEAIELHCLGVAPLASPTMLDFLTLAMRDHGVDLDGLVMSVGISLNSGALVDAKLDLCGHCLTYSDDGWGQIVTDCASRLGVTPFDTSALLGAAGCHVAFLGCGVNVQGQARLNLYLQPCLDTQPASQDALHAMLSDAVTYLTNTQHQDGHWEDFNLPVGVSDQWVTAYLGMSLAKVGHAMDTPEATAAAERAMDWLSQDRPYQAGWGYNSLTGPDSDSTTMVLTLMRALGRIPEAADIDFLASRWQAGRGGVATYDGPMAWGSAHWDVTAYAYAALPPEDRARLADDFQMGLRRNLQPDGTWRAYWWRTPYYSTLITLEALQEMGLPEPDAKQVIGRSPTVDGALDIACSVGIAQLRGAEAEDMSGALAALQQLQLADGRFPGGANLRVTDETCHAPWDVPMGEYYTDTAGSITTATAVRVLALLCTGANSPRPRQVL